MVEVAVLDAQGRVVPTADNPVSFEVTGAGHVAGVGNGDPSSHEPDKATQRHAFNGLCMVIVGAGAKSGSIQITAHAPGLKDALVLLLSGVVVLAGAAAARRATSGGASQPGADTPGLPPPLPSGAPPRGLEELPADDERAAGRRLQAGVAGGHGHRGTG